MKKSALFLAAMVAAFGGCAVLGAGEELMPLVPGAFSPVELDADGMPLRRVSSVDAGAGEGKRPALRKNIIRLTMPSLGDRTNSKMRMVEAAPAGPDGTLRFRPLESMPAAAAPSLSPAASGGRGQADIPGLVLPEFLAVSRMEQSRASEARGGFSPVRLPGALASGTEELREFDPYSVQRTGNPFKDAPGTAEAFPAAAMQSRVWKRPASANNELRPPKTAVDAAPGAQGLSLRPPPVAGLSSPMSSPASSGASLRPVAAVAPQAAPITVAEITLPAVQGSLGVRQMPGLQEMPPLPELPVRSYAGGGQARRTDVVSLPPPLPDHAARNRGEFSLLTPSAQSAVAAGLSLALPPTALTEGGGTLFVPPAQPAAAAQTQPRAQTQPIRPVPVVAEGAFLQPGEKIIDPQTLAPAAQGRQSRQMVQAPAARSVPALRADEFTPMRGMRVY